MGPHDELNQPETAVEASNEHAETATEGSAADTTAPAAPEPEATEPQAAEPEVAEPPAPAPLSAFGLLFQAPDPQAVAPRRAAPVQVREERSDADGTDDADGSDRNTSDRADNESDNDDDNGNPRARRRGGRGRRGKSAAERNSEDRGDDTTDHGNQGSGKASGSDDDGDDNSGTDGDNEDSASRRRTRRRRRSGSGATDNDDPPGTVTKVRAPRRDNDEVTAIKGSTRLEAKKQRRREGREAGRRRTVITEAEFLARRESVERVMVVREKDGRTQIGVLEDNVLVEHYVARESQQSSMAGNVYLGRVQNVLPSMEAAFVDIGRGRNAVLYAGEVNWDLAGLDGQPKRIEHALKSGDSVLVQVTKDPIGHKGARLTSQISLPGRFLVYVPGNSMTGISRKLPDVERNRLKKILKETVPEGAGVIVRTAAEGASEEDLRTDVERLQATWDTIQADVKTANAPALLHGEADLTVRVIRDVFNEDFAKLVVSGDRAWKLVNDYVSSVAPDLVSRLQKWTGENDAFAKYRIDEQLMKAMDRKVWLPSGGSLVIDRTEAMTVVDVNTGKFVGSGGNLEETVTKNNIEAAEEIVRQLRLRDIGGIIVIDFIDMVLESNRDLVVRRLLECLGRDRTKHQVAEVTSLGLVQMTRKRVGSGLIEVFSEPCTHCEGRGIVVHDQPVDHKSGSDHSHNNGHNNGNSSNTGDSSSRSRKSRGRKNDQGSNQSHGSPGEDSKPTGPTAAQIAAAAHAAAMTAGDKPAAEGADAIPALAVLAPQVAATLEPASPDAAASEPAAPVAEPAAPQLAAPTAKTAEAPKRKKRKRVVAPAGPPNHVDSCQDARVE